MWFFFHSSWSRATQRSEFARSGPRWWLITVSPNSLLAELPHVQISGWLNFSPIKQKKKKLKCEVVLSLGTWNMFIVETCREVWCLNYYYKSSKILAATFERPFDSFDTSLILQAQVVERSQTDLISGLPHRWNLHPFDVTLGCCCMGATQLVIPGNEEHKEPCHRQESEPFLRYCGRTFGRLRFFHTPCVTWRLWHMPDTT